MIVNFDREQTHQMVEQIQVVYTCIVELKSNRWDLTGTYRKSYMWVRDATDPNPGLRWRTYP